MEKKRRITFYTVLNGPHEDQVREMAAMTPEERWQVFLRMQRRHYLLFGRPQKRAYRIQLEKPQDIDDDGFVHFVMAADTNKFDYILVGGMALILNGGVRYTEDVDVWMQPTNENRDRLMDTLFTLGFAEDKLPTLRNADFTQPQILRLEEHIDVMMSVHYQLDYFTMPAKNGRNHL